MRQHGEEIVSDFQEYYGLDLSDVLTGRLSVDRAMAYLRQLPMHSRTVAAMRGGEEYRDWGPAEYMLANVIDAINDNTWVSMAKASKKKPKQPARSFRPGDTQKKKKENPFRAQYLARADAARKAKGL